jgi:hypothetical protein
MIGRDSALFYLANNSLSFVPAVKDVQTSRSHHEESKI